jgi:hypothetical protein
MTLSFPSIGMQKTALGCGRKSHQLFVGLGKNHFSINCVHQVADFDLILHSLPLRFAALG